MSLTKRKIFNSIKVLLFGFTILNIILTIVLLPTLWGALQPFLFSIILIPCSLIVLIIDLVWKKRLQSNQDELSGQDIVKIYAITIAIVVGYNIFSDFIGQVDTFLYNNVFIYQELTHMIGGY